MKEQYQLTFIDGTVDEVVTGLIELTEDEYEGAIKVMDELQAFTPHRFYLEEV